MREEVDYTEAVETFKDEVLVRLEPWGMNVDYHWKREHTIRWGKIYV